MKYFNNLPLITQTDPYGNNVTVNNIMARAYFIPSLLNNLMMFYTYDIKENDRPEIISYKYYGDLYNYWILFYSNNYLDPQSSWPLNNQQFLLYLNDKYAESANGVQNVLSYVTSTVYGYYQIITTYDSSSTEGQTIRIQIDEDTYTTLMPSEEKSVFSNGVVATKKIDKMAQSIFDYENELNESKRNIKIMNNLYTTAVEEQFKNLMRV